MLRNFISVTGITPENKLPKEIKGELLQHSDIDYIFLPSSRPKVKELTHIGIEVEIKNQRVIKAPTGNVVILDGTKKLKISYVPLGHSRKNVQLELELPYNTFIELPDGVESLSNLDIYIADAYFELVEGRKIYSYIFYMINVDYLHITTSVEPSEEVEEDEEEIQENSEPKEDFLDELRRALSPYNADDFEDHEENYDENNIEIEDEPYND
jgi:hypothetical protein